jgi:teichuronic acid biosynthesis glycosyltransferase TuaG
MTNEKPRVTIIIPTFNAGNSISKTIDSVVSQTYTSWQLLIVDDCSTDSTREEVEKYSEYNNRIMFHSLVRNSGSPARPRNVGVQLSKTEWVAFLDADDIWHPNKLEYQFGVIDSSGADFCSTGMVDFSDDNQISNQSFDSLTITKLTFRNQLRKNRVPTSSVVVRRDIMLRHPFIEDLRYKAREDYECWLKIHEEIGETLKIKNNLMYYRKSDGQISGSKIKMAMKNFMVLDEYRMINGQGLGLWKYYFFLHYLFQSFYYRVIKKSL